MIQKGKTMMIDGLIKDKQKIAFLKNDLDVNEILNDSVMREIYCRVYCNMKKIVESNTYDYIAAPQYDTKKLTLCKRLDKIAKSIPLYNKIRPIVKNKLSFLKYTKYININDILLLEYEDAKFINNLYNVLLERNAKESDVNNCLDFLRNNKKKRIDLIIAFSESDEFKVKNIVIKGLLLSKIKRKIIRW